MYTGQTDSSRLIMKKQGSNPVINLPELRFLYKFCTKTARADASMKAKITTQEKAMVAMNSSNPFEPDGQRRQ